MPFQKGHKSYHTEESRKKISQAMKNRKVSATTRKKLRKANLGRDITWGEKISNTLKEKGIKPPSRKGIKCTDEQKEKTSKKLLGQNAPNWKGGITPINTRIRNSLQYRKWRTSVFERDDYTCQDCGDDKGGNLQADHIKPFSLFPDLRFEISNGRTLCEECHKKTDTYLQKLYEYKKNLAV